MSRAEVARSPAVAGLFYPANATELAEVVDNYMARAKQVALDAPLRALICPHAGYRYSGQVAAAAYRLLRDEAFSRVVVLAPSHHVAFRGLAIPECDSFLTPLGKVKLWTGCRELAQEQPFIVDPRPHVREHAIEVQLPFLQRALGDFELVPIVFGLSELQRDPPSELEVLSQLANDQTLFVVSTDLSHDRSYDDACRVDRQTIDQMEARSPDGVAAADACGRAPAAALMHLAKRQRWSVRLIDYCNSGDIAGRDSRIVGYAALAATG